MNKERIKMRVNKDGEKARCSICNTDRLNSLEMFDLCFDNAENESSVTLRICDLCCNKLNIKTLRAVCHVNEKVKSQHDMKVIQKRNRRKISIF